MRCPHHPAISRRCLWEHSLHLRDTPARKRRRRNPAPAITSRRSRPFSQLDSMREQGEEPCASLPLSHQRFSAQHDGVEPVRQISRSVCNRGSQHLRSGRRGLLPQFECAVGPAMHAAQTRAQPDDFVATPCHRRTPWPRTRAHRNGCSTGPSKLDDFDPMKSTPAHAPTESRQAVHCDAPAMSRIARHAPGPLHSRTAM